MSKRSVQGLTCRLFNQFLPPGCRIHAAVLGNGTVHSFFRGLHTKSQAPVSGCNDDAKAPGTVKITQRIGLFDYTAEYKEGELKWCTTDKHDDPAESEDDSAKGKNSVLAWIQKKYRIQKNRAKDSLAALFLPVGYPLSVKDNYLQFSTLATVSMFFMNTCTTVGSTFLLYAAGLGRAESAATASAINWIVKDGIGQAGTLVTARMFSHDFDLNTRSWYIFANVLACLAAVAEILTNSYHPSWFIPIASVANTLKGISGLASSSSRAALHVSFARGENIADITAKSHSQCALLVLTTFPALLITLLRNEALSGHELSTDICPQTRYIFSYLSGTVAGILVAGSIDKGDWMSAVQASFVLTALTGATSYIAIRTVPLSALNSSRIQLLLDHYVSVNAAIVNPAKIGLVRLPYPSELCAVDPVAPSWAMPWSSMFCPSIEVNRPIRDLLPGTVRDSAEKLRMLVAVHAGAKHFLMRDGRARSSKLHILLREDASPEDAIMAMLHAILVRKEIKRHEKDVLELDEDIRIVAKELKRSLRHRTALIESLKSANWNLARVAIESETSRGRWD